MRGLASILCLQCLFSCTLPHSVTLAEFSLSSMRPFVTMMSIFHVCTASLVKSRWLVLWGVLLSVVLPIMLCDVCLQMRCTVGGWYMGRSVWSEVPLQIEAFHQKFDV